MQRCDMGCGRTAVVRFKDKGYCFAHVGRCPNCSWPVDPHGNEPCARCEKGGVTPPKAETPAGVTEEPQAADQAAPEGDDGVVDTLEEVIEVLEEAAGVEIEVKPAVKKTPNRRKKNARGSK